MPNVTRDAAMRTIRVVLKGVMIAGMMKVVVHANNSKDNHNHNNSQHAKTINVVVASLNNNNSNHSNNSKAAAGHKVVPVHLLQATLDSNLEVQGDNLVLRMLLEAQVEVAPLPNPRVVSSWSLLPKTPKPKAVEMKIPNLVRPVAPALVVHPRVTAVRVERDLRPQNAVAAAAVPPGKTPP